MSRPIIVRSSIALLLGATVIGLAAPASGARARPALAASAGICPGAMTLKARGAIIPCCPVPVGGAPAATVPCCAGSQQFCCPSNALCANPLTIGASPDPSTAGQKVVISGGAVGAAGKSIALYERLAGQSAFAKVASGTIDSTGHYKFTRTGVQTNRQWYVVEQSERSATVSQSVRALVGLSKPAHGAKRGHAVTLTGHVTPSAAGMKVVIEQRQGGKWKVLGSARCNHASNYSLKHTFANAGKVRLRAELPADAQSAQSFSRTLTVTVPT